MCTVTFIPGNKKYFITSNRDEKITRKPAVPPDTYQSNGHTLVYPKDADAGGTWIAMNAHGNAAVLLNGAFAKHVSSPPYQKSRGVVFTNIMGADMPVNHFRQLDITGVEPFTIILFEQGCLYIGRWDGNRKYIQQLEASRPYIWSSVTLYSEDILKKREQWFLKWLNSHPDADQAAILHFHRFAGEGDATNDIRMNRNDNLLTVSITGMELMPEKGIMQYHDLQKNQQYMYDLAFLPVLASS